MRWRPVVGLRSWAEEGLEWSQQGLGGDLNRDVVSSGPSERERASSYLLLSDVSARRQYAPTTGPPHRVCRR